MTNAAPPARRLKLLLALAAALAVGFAGGWFAVQWRDRTPTGIAGLVAPAAPASAAVTGKSGPPLTANAATLEQILAEPDRLVRMQKLYGFVAKLDAAGVRALIKQLQKIHPVESWSETEWVREALVDRLLELSPAAALAWAKSANPSVYGYLITKLFSDWAAQDPAAALAGAQTLPPAVRTGALESVADAWAKLDPAAAYAWANALPPTPSRAYLIHVVLSTIAINDPANAVAYLDKVPSTDERNAFIVTIAGSWYQKDPGAALAWLNQAASGPVYNQAFANIFQNLLNTGSDQIPALLGKIPESVLVDNTGSIASWANQDPLAVVTWLQSLPAAASALASSWRNSIMLSVISGLSASDPASAASYFQALTGMPLPPANSTIGGPFAPTFDSTASLLAAHWAQTDPAAALAWAQSLPEGTTRDSALGSALSTLGTYDPETAVQDAEQILPAGNFHDKIIDDVLESTASQNPADATALLGYLSTGSAQEDESASLAYVWAQQDANATTQWVNSLPAGSVRDGAAAGLAGMIASTDPAGALNLAVSIGDPSKQFPLVKSILQQWAATDPTAAAAALQNYQQSATLTSDEQASLGDVLQYPGAGLSAQFLIQSGLVFGRGTFPLRPNVPVNSTSTTITSGQTLTIVTGK
jgi:hypothetical protein